MTCIHFEIDDFMVKNFWVKYCLSFRVILMNWLKFLVCFVSRTYWLISCKICSTNWTIDGIGIEGCIDIGKDKGTNVRSEVVIGNPN
jgi:hypothetical protein